VLEELIFCRLFTDRSIQPWSQIRYHPRINFHQDW
jgi:hypothetical protein